MKKLSNTEAELKKSVAYKKNVYLYIKFYALQTKIQVIKLYDVEADGTCLAFCV